MDINEVIDDLEIEGLNKDSLKRLVKPIPFVSVNTAYGITGIAFFEKIVIDTWQLNNHDDKKKLYIILHEVCHFLRLNRMGKKNSVKNYLTDDFDVFSDFMIGEEVLADRYACFMFNKLTEQIYDWRLTQELNLPYKKEDYKNRVVSRMFNKFKTEEEFEEFGKNFYKEK